MHNLINKLIPHFEKFPLLSKKAADFILFKQIVELMSNKAHLTGEGLQHIINLRASMNFDLSDIQINQFPNIIPVAWPIINTTNIPNPNWLAVFTSGEGCFYVDIFKSKK